MALERIRKFFKRESGQKESHVSSAEEQMVFSKEEQAVLEKYRQCVCISDQSMVISTRWSGIHPDMAAVAINKFEEQCLIKKIDENHPYQNLKDPLRRITDLGREALREIEKQPLCHEKDVTIQLPSSRTGYHLST